MKRTIKTKWFKKWLKNNGRTKIGIVPDLEGSWGGKDLIYIDFPAKYGDFDNLKEIIICWEENEK